MVLFQRFHNAAEFHSHNEKIYGSLIQVNFQNCQKALKTLSAVLNEL